MNRKHESKAYIASYEDYGAGLTQGPDPEDLINSVESRFGVIIRDEEAEEIRTPAQLIDLILTKIESREPGECMGQRAFHLIRRAAVRSFGLQRRSISPASKLDEIVPRKLRHARWNGFGTNIGAASWPKLKRSRTTFAVLAVLTLSVFVFVSSQLSESGVLNALLSSALTIAFAIGLSWITRPLKRVSRCPVLRWPI